MSNIITKPVPGNYLWVEARILFVVETPRRLAPFPITSPDCWRCNAPLRVIDFLEADGFVRVNGDSKYGYEGCHVSCTSRVNHRLKTLYRDVVYKIKRLILWTPKKKSKTLQKEN